MTMPNRQDEDNQDLMPDVDKLYPSSLSGKRQEYSDPPYQVLEDIKKEARREVLEEVKELIHHVKMVLDYHKNFRSPGGHDHQRVQRLRKALAKLEKLK